MGKATPLGRPPAGREAGWAEGQEKQARRHILLAADTQIHPVLIPFPRPRVPLETSKLVARWAESVGCAIVHVVRRARLRSICGGRCGAQAGSRVSLARLTGCRLSSGPNCLWPEWPAGGVTCAKD